MRKGKLKAIALVALFCFVLSIPMSVEAGTHGVAPELLGASAFTEYYEPNEVPGQPSGEWLFRVGCLVQTIDGDSLDDLDVEASPVGRPDVVVTLTHRGSGYFLNDPEPWEGFYQNLVEVEGFEVWRVTATDTDEDFDQLDTDALDKPLLMPTAENIQYNGLTAPPTITWDPVTFLVEGTPTNAIYRVRLYDSAGSFLTWSTYLTTPFYEVPSGLLDPTDPFYVQVESVHYESGIENRGNAFNLIVPGVAPVIVGASTFTDYYEPNSVPGMPSDEWLFRVGCLIEIPDGEPFENLVVTAAPPGMPGEAIELIHSGGGYFLNDPVPYPGHYQNLVEVLGQGVWTVTATDSDGDSVSLDSNDLDNPYQMETVSYIVPDGFTNAPRIYWSDVSEALYRVRIYDVAGNFLHWSGYIFETYYDVPGGILQFGLSYFIQVESIYYDSGIENRGNAFIEFTVTQLHSKMDRGHSVVEVFDEFGEPDGFAIAGMTRGEYGDYDFLLIRTNADGDEIWRRNYDPGDYSANIAYDLIQCSDGGFAMIGQALLGYSDALLVRTDSNGENPWFKRLDNNGRNDMGYSLIELSDGGFAIAGSTSSGPGSSGDHDGWLIITDSMGEIDWDRSQIFGDEDSEIAYQIIAHPDGGFAITGYVYDATTYTSDMWLLRVNDDGTWWDRTYGEVGPDYGFSIVLTDDGGYAIGGFTYNYGAVWGDAWIVHIDADGNYLRSEIYGGDGQEGMASLVKCAGGGYALGTFTYNYDTNSYDFWLLTFSDSWEVTGSEMFGTPDYNYFWSMIQTDSRGFAMVGWSGMGITDVLLVLVPSAQDETGDIIDEVDDLVDSGDLDDGLAESLNAKLEAVILLLNSDDPRRINAARKLLISFIKQVDALVRSGQLSVEDGNQLIALAEEVLDMIANM